jgi:acyl-CoA synthetase (AMP-forming)/AMP-acid ligase II
VNWIRERLTQFNQQLMSVKDAESVTYANFLEKVDSWKSKFNTWEINAGDRVAVVADYHIDVVALLLALVESACIVIPLSEDDRNAFEERLDTVAAKRIITIMDSDNVNVDTVVCQKYTAPDTDLSPLMASLINSGKAGFVIYTSGSTGKSKAVLLDFERMVKKHKSRGGKSFKTLLFLKLDHIGGLNTLLSVILNGGTIVSSPSRQAKDICQTIEKYSVELLPTTPSFLTMLLISRIYSDFNLRSLKVITYGTEVMPNSTLTGVHKILPEVVLKQTYGLSELGILSTQSKSSDSKWMKIGGEGFEVKVKDDVLWIKSDQAMLGYLNAESPFDNEGWYNTGDKVEVDGEYFRILGRESEIINVAGEKVFPIEIESYLLTLENVRDVVVRGKNNPVTGQIIWAEFVLDHPEDLDDFKKRIIALCQSNFPAFKVPRLITVTTQDNVVGNRFKKIRKG